MVCMLLNIGKQWITYLTCPRYQYSRYTSIPLKIYIPLLAIAGRAVWTALYGWERREIEEEGTGTQRNE